MINNSKRGDTLIEVLLAVTIFSMVSVLSVIVMNRSSATAERSLETTLVKQQIDSQVEELRAAQQAASRSDKPSESSWAKITNVADTGAVAVGADCPVPPSGSFFIRPTGSSEVDTIRGQLVVAAGVNFVSMNNELTKPYSQVEGDKSYGIWIEKQDITAIEGFGKAYDFTVRACWYGPGLEVPMQLDTTVRLYDPLP